MKIPLRKVRQAIVFVYALMLFSSCSKIYQPQNISTTGNEAASAQIEQLSYSNQSLSGISSIEIISNSPVFYAHSDETAAAPAHAIAQENNKYSLLQPISPIIKADTLPLDPTGTPIISKENNTALALGIIGILFPIVAIILAPIGLAKAKKAKKQIIDNPEKYKGLAQANTAVALNIISLVLFVLLVISLIFLILILFQFLAI